MTLMVCIGYARRAIPTSEQNLERNDLKLLLNITISLALLASLSLQAKESVTIELSGRLVKKEFEAPPIVKNPASGWFLELDPTSKQCVKSLELSLSEEEKRDITLFKVRSDLVQLLIDMDGDKEKCHHLEGERIRVKGKIENPPYPLSAIPSYQMQFHYDFLPQLLHDELAEKKQETASKKFLIGQELYIPAKVNPERYGIDINSLSENLLELPEGAPEILTKLNGTLVLRLSPGPPNYSSTEGGDYPCYVWFLQMDVPSFQKACQTPVWGYALSLQDIMSKQNWFEVQLGADPEWEDFCCQHFNQEIVVEGYLFHAHTSHHDAPFQIAVKHMDVSY